MAKHPEGRLRDDACVVWAVHFIHTVSATAGRRPLTMPRLQDFADGIFMMQSLKLADEMAAASVNHPLPERKFY